MVNEKAQIAKDKVLLSLFLAYTRPDNPLARETLRLKQAIIQQP
jgi:hypothetical protein